MAQAAFVAPPRGRGGARAWWELVRPFSFAASVVPVVVGAAAAAPPLSVGRLGVALLGVLLLQAGANAVNEVFDVRRGADTPATPRASRVVLERRLAPSAALAGGVALLATGVGIGAALAWGLGLGPLPFALGLLGALAGFAYSAPPCALKYRGLGLAVEAPVLGPVLVASAAWVGSGHVPAQAWVASAPVGCLVGAVLLANDLRDRDTDAAAGARTLAVRLGPRGALWLYRASLAGAYAALALGVGLGAMPWPALAAGATAPWAARAARAAARGAPALGRLDQATMRLHLAFGLLLAAALWVARR
jgi:1,4-dihydroxy-2-naphthoate octaprenyltransferase